MLNWSIFHCHVGLPEGRWSVQQAKGGFFFNRTKNKKGWRFLCPGSILETQSDPHPPTKIDFQEDMGLTEKATLPETSIAPENGWPFGFRPIFRCDSGREQKRNQFFSSNPFIPMAFRGPPQRTLVTWENWAPKDWQVASALVMIVGFLLLFRDVSGDYDKACIWSVGWSADDVYDWPPWTTQTHWALEKGVYTVITLDSFWVKRIRKYHETCCVSMSGCWFG